MKIENKKAGVKKEFPRINVVFGNVSDTSSTGMGY